VAAAQVGLFRRIWVETADNNPQMVAGGPPPETTGASKLK